MLGWPGRRASSRGFGRVRWPSGWPDRDRASLLWSLLLSLLVWLVSSAEMQDILLVQWWCDESEKRRAREKCNSGQAQEVEEAGATTTPSA